ncbi:MAG: hypothetical protein NVV73_09005 [Cellvibrionaceae bacterium]|nr:hypothetical protein [Cellvibrionaceae bacterium]
MTQEDSTRVLQYLNDCGAQFNTMMQEVIKRLLGHQIPAAINPFFPAQTVSQALTGAVKLTRALSCSNRCNFWKSSSGCGTTPRALFWEKCRSP